MENKLHGVIDVCDLVWVVYKMISEPTLQSL